MAKMIGFGPHRLDHVGVTAPFAERPKNTSAPAIASASVRASVLTAKARLPLVHALGAAFVDHALGVARGSCSRAEADGAQQLETGDAGRRRRRCSTILVRLDLAAGERERVDQAGGGDDGGAVLIVMKDRDVEQLAQPLLDDEALRRLDVLEVDAAPALAEQLDAIDDLVGSSDETSRSMESMSAKRLNSTALPSITGLAASAPRLPSPGWRCRW
jgi:hypothetical protein